jgi:Transposase DDE domain
MAGAAGMRDRRHVDVHPDTPANLAASGRVGGGNGPSGYPMRRMLTVVACGTRTVLDAVFGPLSVGETNYAPRLLGCLQHGMLLLADRNFAAAELIEQVAATGADLLFRAKTLWSHHHAPFSQTDS